MVALFLAAASYLILQTALTRELFSKLQDLSRMGSALLDKPAVRELAGGIEPEPPEADVLRIEALPEFHQVYDQLNYIREVEPRLVRFVYTFVPTDDPDTALFLVDADALEPAGEDEESSRFGSLFDLSEFEKARLVIAENRPTIDGLRQFRLKEL